MDIGVADFIGPAKASMLTYDGILGLQWQSDNTIRPDASNTFFELAQQYMDQPVLAMNLNQDGSGTMGLGSIDDTAYSGDLVTITIDNSLGANDHWSADTVTFGVGDPTFTQEMIFGTFQHRIFFTMKNPQCRLIFS